jgi:hypothetical protein
MKFDDLYNKVFVSEQDEDEDLTATDKEVADPADFNDVEPLPLPEPAEVPETPLATDGTEPAPAQPVSGGSISTYISELEEFANKLNGTEANSLQSLVSQLDRPGTPFDGISARTRSEIVRVAETLRSISENLKSFIINAAKK